jgi:membrane associated rhomboid family serine protease
VTSSAGPPPGPPPPAGPPPGPQMVCTRHPDRPTGLACTRCGRPACPECLREASVGYQCVDCVAQAVAPPRGRGARRGTTVAGAEAGHRPVAVPVLIALNVVVFGWTALQAGSLLDNAAAPLFEQWALVPRLVGAGDWWRPLTAGFLHIGPVHLLFNMLALYVLGRDLETVLGRGRFLAVYLVALLGGSAAVMVFSAPGQPVAGASGAVFGLMGGLVVVLRRLRFPLGQVIGLIVVNIVISVVIPGISIVGHLGGLVVGAVATAALVHTPGRGNRPGVQALLLVVLTAVVLAVMWVTTLT